MKLLRSITSCFKKDIREDIEGLRSGVRYAYSAAAMQPDSRHPFPVGRNFAESLGYSKELLDSIPEIAYEAFVGVSNVAVFADIPAGATVLDIGCGAGLDAIIAAGKTGPTGKVIGIDFSDEMLARATEAAQKNLLHDVLKFHSAEAENLPIRDGAADIVLVNGIFNLNPKRDQVFREISRVLQDNGAVYAAELVFIEPVRQKKVGSLDDWFA